MNTQLRNWIGKNKELIEKLKFWKTIRKYIKDNFNDEITARETYDILYPEKIMSCQSAKFIGFSVGYRSCHKGCECYTKKLSEKIRDIKLSVTEDKKQEILDKRKETVWAKYGVDNVFKSDKIKQQAFETKIIKYGNPTFTNPDKTKQTNISRYGVENVMQVKDYADKVNVNKDHTAIVEKVKNTKLIKYGDANYNNRKQIEQTNLEKYGVTNAAKCPRIQDKISDSSKEISVLSHSEKYNITPMFAFEEYIPGEQNKWKCNSCGSVINGKVVSGKFTRCIKCYPFNSSKAEVEWLDSLHIPSECRQIFLKIGERRYHVDALVENTVYEFWGDFWHGNPEKFIPTDINPKNNIPFGVLYKSTMTKRELIKQAGFTLIEIWESEYRAERSKLKEN